MENSSDVSNNPVASPQADLSNWRSPPFNRWAFQNVGRLIPMATIEASSSAPWDLPAAPVVLDDIVIPNLDGNTMDLGGYLEATATDALIVLANGRVAFEYYANGMEPDTTHIIKSATKSVTGLIAGIVASSGKLDVDAAVSAYVPEVLGTAYAGSTVRQLLDMRTGIVLNSSQQRAYDIATGWFTLAPGEQTDGMHGFFSRLAPDDRPHGGPFSYVSPNTDLLGWVLERATGQTFAALTSTLMWQPMGAEHDASITVDQAGAARCTGGLCTTARDFARLGQLVLQGGRRDDTQVIPSAWIEDMVSNGDRASWDNGGFSQGSFVGLPMSYRSNWYNVHWAPEILFAMGIFGQNLFIDRANQIVIAKMSSWPAAMDPPAVKLTHRGVGEILKRVRDAAPC